MKLFLRELDDSIAGLAADTKVKVDLGCQIKVKSLAVHSSVRQAGNVSHGRTLLEHLARVVVAIATAHLTGRSSQARRNARGRGRRVGY